MLYLKTSCLPTFLERRWLQYSNSSLAILGYVSRDELIIGLLFKIIRAFDVISKNFLRTDRLGPTSLIHFVAISSHIYNQDLKMA